VPRAPSANMVWFSMSIGRNAKADPKWLLPMICRMGGVEKRDIGAIRILDRETRFEIAAEIAGEFLANLPKDGTDEVRVSPSEAPASASASRGPAPKRPFMKAPPPKKAKKARPA
jgi:ATP-dependent RNA helicase DeaD